MNEGNVVIVITGIALVGVQLMEGNSKDMQNHSFKLIGAEAGSTKFQVDNFPWRFRDSSWDFAAHCRGVHVALELMLDDKQLLLLATLCGYQQ